MIIIYRRDGLTKAVPTGFSWTTFFFGLFPALFRGDIFHTVLIFITALCTFGLSSLVWPFIYNGLYLNRMLSHGWQLRPIGSNGDEPLDDMPSSTSSRPIYHEPEFQVKEMDVYSAQYERLFGPVTGAEEHSTPDQSRPIQQTPRAHKNNVIEAPRPAMPAPKTFGRKVVQ